jgi:hypothetical protein
MRLGHDTVHAMRHSGSTELNAIASLGRWPHCIMVTASLAPNTVLLSARRRGIEVFRRTYFPVTIQAPILLGKDSLRVGVDCL